MYGHVARMGAGEVLVGNFNERDQLEDLKVGVSLTLILLTWRIWRAPNNASKWKVEFNSAFKGLILKQMLKKRGLD